MDAIAETIPSAGLAPFSLKDAPALIERVFPAQKVGIEAQKERKSNATQTLTALGSYWKGRKPLVLVRACILASLLPATDDAEADLEVFSALMGMDDDGLMRRKPQITPDLVFASPAVSDMDKAAFIEAVEAERGQRKLVPSRQKKSRSFRWRTSPKGKRDLRSIDRRSELELATFLEMPFSEKVNVCDRMERLERLCDPLDPMYAGVMDKVNAVLRTRARTLPELVEELGIARYGHPVTVGDPFAGGGSIPFEAGRLGCRVAASDLNPVAATLTWGSFHVVGADADKRKAISKAEARVMATVDAAVTRLGVEHNGAGDRARSYLYCLEVLDPQTGWLIPLCPSWVVSQTRKCIARLEPDYATKSFVIRVEEGVSRADLTSAALGTEQNGFLVYCLAPIEGETPQRWRISLNRLRGDREGEANADGARGNLLRRWEKSDVAPRRPVWDPLAKPVINGAEPGGWVGGDILLERLYCIRWVRQACQVPEGEPADYFAAPDGQDQEREVRLQRIASENLQAWQEKGLVPDMPIERGAKTDEPIRTRGWTFWHHLFNPRQLLLAKEIAEATLDEGPEMRLLLPKAVNVLSRLCRINSNGAGGEALEIKDTFSNQALNTLLNYGCRGFLHVATVVKLPPAVAGGVAFRGEVLVHPVSNVEKGADLWIYDPPYADAVHYHEITEFFIAWLRKNPPSPFNQWTWDSRRPLAIQGKGEKFRTDMVDALRAMSNRMPDNGLQVCMFTHQDAGVWADMAQIVWGAGLRVTAAWYVSTETTSEQKKGGYVQGTVLLILRKRQGDERAYKDELVLEVRGAVQRQVELLTGLNQRAKARQRDENPFSDADVQMAGYAAALEVLTGYTHIEGVDMTREALRPRVKGQVGIVEEMIALAVQTATELMRPDGIDESLWERLIPLERFWLKMTEAESNRPTGQPAGKLDDYQNFAKAYRADGWDDLMADSTPNKARLKGATDFKRAMMTGHPFGGGLVRPVLYAINELRMSAEKEEDHATSSERAISGLRDNLKSWAQQRQQAMVIADWLGRALARHRPAEASAARTLAALIRTERLG
jgi:putative DNA methylase